MRLMAAEIDGLLFHPETDEMMSVEEFCQLTIEPFGKEAGEQSLGLSHSEKAGV